MIDTGNGLFLPENSPASPEILATLVYFGLKEDRFTFAPASGGVLVFSPDYGILWFPKIIMDLLGVQMIRSRGVEETLQYLGEIAGSRAGWAVGWTAGGAAAAVAAIAGFSTGLWIPVAAGTFIGSQLGAIAMKRLGFRGPPKELAAYPVLLVDHVEVLSPSYLTQAYEQTKRLLKKTKEKLSGKMGNAENPIVLTVVKRFKSSTDELKSLKKLHDQEQKEKSVGNAIGGLVGGTVDFLKGTHSIFDILDTEAETFGFDDPSYCRALIASLKNHDVKVVEK
ncbi:MAG: hypothetical protein LJE96_06970 [Deltaproteobacteria bacterium]|nr:hypothetical protein [Deltaproteobacteria bacterium]